MNPSFILFLKRFYGDKFNREFARQCISLDFDRRPCYTLEDLINRFKVYEKRSCSVYTNVYDFNHENPIPLRNKKPKGWKYPYETEAIIDRIFLDFDKDLTDKATVEYNHLLSAESKQDFYRRLIEQGQTKDPIKEAKIVSKYICDTFQGDPLLVFSGAKGCHLYIFFKPLKLQYPKEVLKYFLTRLEEILRLKYLDPKIKGDLSRVSRIPTSQHPKTGLYSHPWKMDYRYDEIIANSMDQQIPFDTLDLENRRSNLEDLLKIIDTHIHLDKEHLQNINKLRKLTAHPIKKKHDNIKIKAPSDILKLNTFPCFNNLPYTHDSRLILAQICIWHGLNPEDTLKALKIFTEDKGYYNPNKHLHNIQQIRTLKKYVFTCKTMKQNNLCNHKEENKFCKKWFYLKLGFPNKFHELLDGYLSN